MGRLKLLVGPVRGSRTPPLTRGPTDHINTRTSHSGSKGQYEGDTRARNHGMWDPYVNVVF